MDNDNQEPGKYDNEAQQMMVKLQADMVILLVTNGKRGHGMSCVIDAEVPMAHQMANKTPELLRKMADMIEKQGQFTSASFQTKTDESSWADLSGEGSG